MCAVKAAVGVEYCKAPAHLVHVDSLIRYTLPRNPRVCQYGDRVQASGLAADAASLVAIFRLAEVIHNMSGTLQWQ